MTPETDRAFRDEMAVALIRRALKKSLVVFYVLIALLGAGLIALTTWNLSQCANIYGLSVEGRVFETHSFTCPNPQVEPLYERMPDIR